MKHQYLHHLSILYSTLYQINQYILLKIKITQSLSKMTPDHLKPSDAKLQSFGFSNINNSLQFTFKTDNQKLIIQALSINQKITYQGQLLPNPLIDFDVIKQLLEQGEFKTTIKNQDVLKIKIGPMFLQMTSKNKSEIKQIKDNIKNISEKHNHLESIIHQQKQQAEELKSVIQVLKFTINDFKSSFINQVKQNTRLIALQKAMIDENQSQIGKLKARHKNAEKSFQQLRSRCQNLQKSINFSSTGLSLDSIKWSQTLRSTKIKIQDKSSQRIGEYCQFESQFALLDVKFSQIVKQKQCWGIKIKKKMCGIDIGICLKNMMQKSQFNINYYKWKGIGHGCYLVSSDRTVYSHSFKEYNEVKRGFEFVQGDVVYMEYDPIGWKLRFRKNNGPDSFEMAIQAPPVDDAYHPCVSFCYQNDSAELVFPGVTLS